VDGKSIAWRSELAMGATVYLRHFWGSPVYVQEKSGTVYAFTRVWSPVEQNVGAWIGFNAWSRSGRRGAPTPKLGQWSPCDAKIWLNGAEIAPPQWKQPGVPNEHTSLEIPFVDEDYHYRAPTTESFSVKGEELLAKVKELIAQGNVRSITIQNKQGKTILVLPLTLGVVGALLAPPLAAVGAVAALLTDCTIKVERNV
jgi:hypothetical protein